MAKIANYGALKDTVQLWLNRTDSETINAIPYFINLAEIDFQRSIKLPSQEKTFQIQATTAVPDTLEYIQIPTDYLELKHLSINGNPYNRLSVEAFNRVVADATVNLSDNQEFLRTNYEAPFKGYFTRKDDKFYTYPELKDGDTGEMIYYIEVPEMVNDSDSPPSLDVGSDVILYLALRHASLFLRDPEAAQFWEQKSQDAGAALTRRLEAIEWSGSPVLG